MSAHLDDCEDDFADLSPERRAVERDYMVRLGQRIREIRERKRLTQKDAARNAGIATDMISRIENGRYLSPGLRTLYRIAVGLGTDIGTLLPEEQSNQDDILVARLQAIGQRATADELSLMIRVSEAILQHPGSTGGERNFADVQTPDTMSRAAENTGE